MIDPPNKSSRLSNGYLGFWFTAGTKNAKMMYLADYKLMVIGNYSVTTIIAVEDIKANLIIARIKADCNSIIIKTMVSLTTNLLMHQNSFDLEVDLKIGLLIHVAVIRASFIIIDIAAVEVIITIEAICSFIISQDTFPLLSLSSPYRFHPLIDWTQHIYLLAVVVVTVVEVTRLVDFDCTTIKA